MNGSVKTSIAYFAVHAACLSIAVSPAYGSGESSHDWEFVVSPLFLWAKNVDGSSALAGNEMPTELDFQDDILENLDATFTFRAEARKHRLGYYVEYNFARLEPESMGQLGPVEFVSRVDYEDTLLEAGILWSVQASRQQRVEVLAAARYFDQQIDVDISRSAGAQQGSSSAGEISGGDSWWNGVMGVRYTRAFSTNLAFSVRGDVGYGGEDSKSYQAVGLLNYRFNDWGAAFAGYRYLAVDFDNGRANRDGYSTDVDQQGPLLGVSIYF